MSELPQPTFTIEKIYLKDLSVEVPNAPEVFNEREAPSVNVDMNSQAREVQPGVFEVVLKVTITAKIKDKSLFLVEAAQAGLVSDPQRAAAGHGAAAGHRLSEYAVSLRARNHFDGDRARGLPAGGAGADDVRRDLPAAAGAANATGGGCRQAELMR